MIVSVCLINHCVKECERVVVIGNILVLRAVENTIDCRVHVLHHLILHYGVDLKHALHCESNLPIVATLKDLPLVDVEGFGRFEGRESEQRSAGIAEQEAIIWRDHVSVALLELVHEVKLLSWDSMVKNVDKIASEFNASSIQAGKEVVSRCAAGIILGANIAEFLQTVFNECRVL